MCKTQYPKIAFPRGAYFGSDKWKVFLVFHSNEKANRNTGSAAEILFDDKIISPFYSELHIFAEQ